MVFWLGNFLPMRCSRFSSLSHHHHDIVKRNQIVVKCIRYAVMGELDQFLFNLQGRQLGLQRFLFIIFVVAPISPAPPGEHEQQGDDDTGGPAGVVDRLVGKRVLGIILLFGDQR